MARKPELSVVVGSVASEHTVEACLDSVVRATEGLDVEILLFDASRDRTVSKVRKAFPFVEVEHRPSGTLVPTLWAEGIRRSRGAAVALTTGHCIVPAGWARSLLKALEDAEAAGAGLLPCDGLGPLDRAVFYLRYAGFLGLTEGERRSVPDVPGDNAAYRGDTLRRYMADRTEGGFWEVEYHRRLREDGGRIMAVPEASAGFGRSFPLWVIARHRFAHGRRYGRWKVASGGQSAVRALLPVPVLPPLFLARAVRATRSRRGHLRKLAGAVVPFVVLAGAWAAGEGAGALAELTVGRAERGIAGRTVPPA